MKAIRLTVLAGLLLALGLAPAGCGKKGGDGTPAAGGGGDAAKTKELIVGKWKEKGKGDVTLDFAADRVAYKSTREGASGSGQGSYAVVDAKTLEIPKLAAPADEKVTVDSISADKLVLSGGTTWKFDKTEFVKEK